MSALPRRPFVNAAAILGVGLFALGAASAIPALRKLELSLVEKLALKLDPTRSAFTGDGSPEHPWQRWKAKPDPAPEPVRLLSVDDDAEGWFSQAPPAPVDCAVIFRRLYDAGHRTIACGYLMTWEEPDPLAVVALRKQLDRFDAAVLGLPLSRGAVAEPLPSPYLRLSIPAAKVDGNTAALPQVNKVAAPGAELGGDKTLAGFTLLENEKAPGDKGSPLLARWGDRVIFALPLAAEIAALGLDPAEVQIALGHEIRLGPDGPVVPIDDLGRTALAANPAVADVPAWKLVSEDNPVPPAWSTLLIRDGRTEMPEADKAWTDSLAGLAGKIRSSPRYERALNLPRLPVLAEMGLVLLLAFFAAWATWMKNFFWRLLAAVAAAAFAGELVFLLSSRWNLWLPPLAIAAMSVSSLLLAIYHEPSGVKKPVVNPRPWEDPDYKPQRPVVQEPEIPAAAPIPVPVRGAPAVAVAPLAPLVPVQVPEIAVSVVELPPPPSPAPLPNLTRVKFIAGRVVLPVSAREIWGSPEPLPQEVEEPEDHVQLLTQEPQRGGDIVARGNAPGVAIASIESPIGATEIPHLPERLAEPLAQEEKELTQTMVEGSAPMETPSVPIQLSVGEEEPVPEPPASLPPEPEPLGVEEALPAALAPSPPAPASARRPAKATKKPPPPPKKKSAAKRKKKGR